MVNFKMNKAIIIQKIEIPEETTWSFCSLPNIINKFKLIYVAIFEAFLLIFEVNSICLANQLCNVIWHGLHGPVCKGVAQADPQHPSSSYFKHTNGGQGMCNVLQITKLLIKFIFERQVNIYYAVKFTAGPAAIFLCTDIHNFLGLTISSQPNHFLAG